ncbi:hypothetical protein [Hyperthermus butylicus]|uniref:hypothetical protein n=1 Tax=Hyperthermus butylicus TaxID=54248 RepID=UPI001891561E|nr:hypothetical protein [Hyperthermus butylicus]
MAAIYPSLGAILVLYAACCGGFGGYSAAMLAAAGLLVALSSTNLFVSMLVALLRTDLQLLAFLAGNAARIAVGVGLVVLGFGWAGAVAGFAAMSLVILIVSAAYVARMVGISLAVDPVALREVLTAGLASWLPGVMVLAGQWLGVLAVYGSSTSVETGHYYIAVMIAGFAAAIGTSIASMLLPVLSGVEHGRGELASASLRIALALSMPVSAYIVAYPGFVLGLLGKSYREASTALSILAASAPAMVFYTAVSSLAYAGNRYHTVAGMGFAQNLPRIILYAPLASLYGGLGAAIAYTLEAYTGLAAVYVARQLELRVEPRKLLVAVAMPALLAAAARLASVPAVPALILFAASYIAYGRLRIVSRREAAELASAFIPRDRLEKLYNQLRPLVDLALPT